MYNLCFDTKLKLFSAAERQNLTEHDDIQQHVDEELEVMMPAMKEPIVCKAIPFMCRNYAVRAYFNKITMLFAAFVLMRFAVPVKN